MAIKEEQIYLMMYREVLAALVNKSAHLAPSHMRRELIESAHQYASEATAFILKNMEKENEVRREV
jgi:hypothetical protein